MNVLVCDDDPATRHVLKRLLIRTFGAEVDEAENGLEALDRLSKHHFDVLMLDVHMPTMNGTQMLETLRASDELKDLPVIIITGEKDAAIIKRIIALGVSDFILKPPNVERVTARLERLRQLFGESSGTRGETEGEPPPLREGDAVVLADVDPDYRVGATLEADTKPLIRATTALGQLQVVAPGLRSGLVAAAEELFDLMLSGEVETADEPLTIGDQRSSVATVAVTVEGFTLDFRFRYAFDSGRHIAAAFLEANPEEMTDADVESAAGELSNVIAGRLHDSYVKSGLRSKQGVPRLSTLPPGTPDDAADTEDTVRLSFRAVGRPIAFEAHVCVTGSHVHASQGTDMVGGIAVARAQAS
jgi:two-component system chemotaxis response regulator CheY